MKGEELIREGRARPVRPSGGGGQAEAVRGEKERKLSDFNKKDGRIFWKMRTNRREKPAGFRRSGGGNTQNHRSNREGKIEQNPLAQFV